MDAFAEAAVDVDVPAVVVAAAVVEVPPRSCVDIFMVLTPEDTSHPASWKPARTVLACDRSAVKADIDVDVLDVDVAAAVFVVVEVPPRSCVGIFMVLQPKDTSRPASWKTAHTVQARDCSAAEAAVDVDVPDVVVAAAIVEVPPRSCVNIFTVLPPEDTSRPVIWKTARTVQARDRSAAEAAVDVDVPAVVVAAAVVEAPPCSCVNIFTVLPP